MSSLEIIPLPAVLPGYLDLAVVNQRLRDRTVQLDWSGVTSVPDEALDALFAGLELSDDADVLGFDDGMADTLVEKISAAFTRQAMVAASPPPQSLRPRTTGEAQAQPAIWTDSTNTAGTSADRREFNQLHSSDSTPTHLLSDQLPSHYQLRHKLETLVLNDLLGPAGGAAEEVSDARVSDRYLVGLIAPLHRRKRQDSASSNVDQPNEDSISRLGSVDQQPEELDELAVAGDDGVEDGQSEKGNGIGDSMFPSSIGMTFCVDANATALKITAGWGQYHRTQSEFQQTEAGNPKVVWKRLPISAASPAIPLQAGAIADWQIDPDYAVFVRGQIRQQDQDWIVSLFLVNAQTETDQCPDASWLFQPQLSVTSADEQQLDVFIKRTLHRRSAHKMDIAFKHEEDSLKMLYRHRVEFAVGHGVGVHADYLPDVPTRAVRLATQVVPTYEVAKMTPPQADEIPALSGLVLNMQELADTDGADIPSRLAALPTAYARWIADQRDRLGDADENLADYQNVANDALDNCDRTLARIREGIETLRTNPQAAQAFKFMNRAMYLQRERSLYATAVRQGKNPEQTPIQPPTWYPFQLAFILLNIPSSTDLHHPDRCHETNAIADLLWFPTGGGKTEAYLGLAAYTMGLRRLQGAIAGHSGEAGVAVLMRYTLRLLTLQQFQRATALICACEVIRREDPAIWGEEPFRIGLWVGMNTTPNRTEDSQVWVDALRGNRPPPRSGSPHQLTSCPWCGTPIEGGRHIDISSFKKGTGRTLIYCGDSLGDCAFSKKQSKDEGLPIVVVDEEIYRRLPTLLIATVDKFAQMPWKGATQMLFGRVDGYCDRHGYRSPEIDDENSHPARYGLPKAKTHAIHPLRPPDLIIQDELHLISGPLGTLVGLYETAIDELASWEVNGIKVRPKVIASTATIRQAQAQIHQLFLRRVNIFPPQGLDISDNFFAREREPGETYPGRRYLGICATGRRLKAATIRVYTAVLAASQLLFEQYGDRVDPWMTLVGYFNAMRELGGTRRLVDDDIQQRLNKMDRRGLAKRLRLEVEELTSRKSSTQIPEVLDKLERQFQRQVEQQQNHPNQRQTKGKQVPLDVLLATNMISVGVDVPRLATMVATGQPKTTAEYIQATSRVGRRYPGIVFTIFNWARPRDLSHYERFEHYHATFYQHVESLSLTPFSSGAIDRGLSALLVSLIRLVKSEFNANDRAGRIQRQDPDVQRAIATIVQRAVNVEGERVRTQIQQELEKSLDIWLDHAQDNQGGKLLGYQSERDGLTLGLLQPAGASPWERFTCLNSLRNVEPTIGLILNSNIPNDDSSRIPQPMPPKNDD